MKRRENNQKVITLHSEMRDMIEVFVKCVGLPIYFGSCSRAN
jgi:hypothetical protein